MYRRPTILVFLDLKAAFDSVDRSVLLSTLISQGMPPKFVNVIRSLDSQTVERVRDYGVLSKSLPTTSGVRKGCHLSPFLFNLVMDVVMTRALQGLQKPGVHIFNGEKLADLEYADSIVLLFENASEGQRMLDRLADAVSCFGKLFVPAKCKVSVQDMQQLSVPLVLQDERLDIVEHFTYLGS